MANKEMKTLTFFGNDTYEIVDEKARQDLQQKISNTDKGRANGIASLDNNGKVPSNQLPEIKSYDVGGDELGLVKNGGNVTINPDGTMTAPEGTSSQSDWNATDEAGGAIKNKPPIEKGQGENSLQQTDNLAIGDNSVAQGENSYAYARSSSSIGKLNIAGRMGFTIKSIDVENSRITIDTHGIDLSKDDFFRNYSFVYSIELLINGSIRRYPMRGKSSFISQTDNEAVLSLTNCPTGDEISKWKYIENPVNDNNSISFPEYPGYGGRCLGSYTRAEGLQTRSFETLGHSEGHLTFNHGQGGHTEGYNTTVLATYGHCEGGGANSYLNMVRYYNVSMANVEHLIETWKKHPFSLVANNGSHGEGSNTLILGNFSHGSGFQNIIRGHYTSATGLWNIANGNTQRVSGKYNLADGLNTKGKYLDIVGNGTSDSDSGRSNAYTLDLQGNAVFAGLISSKGEDYAEFFEWLDGNQNNEDRIGLLVTLEGEKIRLANQGDEILGIISGTVAVLGGNYEWEWNGKYLTDDFGRIIYEDVEEFMDEIVCIDEETNEPIIEKKSLGFFKHPVLNPNYDPEQTYINRSDRPEWDTVGMLGKLFVRDDGTCQVNGYATVGENGIAIASSEKTNMRVLSRVNENIVRVLLK